MTSGTENSAGFNIHDKGLDSLHFRENYARGGYTVIVTVGRSLAGSNVAEHAYGCCGDAADCLEISVKDSNYVGSRLNGRTSCDNANWDVTIDKLFAQ